MGLLRWPFIAIAALAGCKPYIGAWKKNEKGRDYRKVMLFCLISPQKRHEKDRNYRGAALLRH